MRRVDLLSFYVQCVVSREASRKSGLVQKCQASRALRSTVRFDKNYRSGLHQESPNAKILQNNTKPILKLDQTNDSFMHCASTHTKATKHMLVQQLKEAQQVHSNLNITNIKIRS